MKLREIQVACDDAVKAIATLPHCRWAEWTTYFLEAVDAKAQERHEQDGDRFGTADSILVRTSMSLRTRIAIGRW